MSYTIYTVSCNFTTHATYLLALIAYKYNELQMFFATQKLSCKANCKTPFFYNVWIFRCFNFNAMTHESLLLIYKTPYFYLNHLVNLLFFVFFVLHWLFNLWLSFSTLH
jgi:hypothetical protein